MDFKKKTTQNTARRAYRWVLSKVGRTRVRSISLLQIRKGIGDTSKPLPAYFAHLLLKCVDAFYHPTAHISRKYLMNQSGMEYVRQQLEDPFPQSYADWLPEYKQLHTSPADDEAVVALIQQEYRTELAAGNWQMNQKSDRYHNPFQNVPSRYRSPVLARAGLKHDYDIICAAATLLYQYAQRQEPTLYGATIETYLADRTAFRNKIVADTGLSYSDVKAILNALLNGAGLGAYTKMGELAGDRLPALQQNADIKALRLDIKRMWAAIKPTIYRKPKHNRMGALLSPTRRLDAKEKATLYRQLESEVMRAVLGLLEYAGIPYKHIHIHDGFVCDHKVDARDIQQRVYERTRYRIHLEYKELSVTVV